MTCQCRLAAPLLDGLASPRLLSTDSPRHASCQRTRLAAPSLHGLALPHLLSTGLPRRASSQRSRLAAPPLNGVASPLVVTSPLPGYSLHGGVKRGVPVSPRRTSTQRTRLAAPPLDGLAASSQRTRVAAPPLHGLASPRLLSTESPRRTSSQRSRLAARSHKPDPWLFSEWGVKWDVPVSPRCAFTHRNRPAAPIVSPRTRPAAPSLHGLASPHLLSMGMPRRASCQRSRLAAPPLYGVASPLVVTSPIRGCSLHGGVKWGVPVSPRHTSTQRTRLAAPSLPSFYRLASPRVSLIGGGQRRQSLRRQRPFGCAQMSVRSRRCSGRQVVWVGTHGGGEGDESGR